MASKKRKLTGDESGRTSKKQTRVAKVPSTEMRITRRMATNMSRNAVFGTAELLEAIIVCLPVRDALAVQGVSQQFRDVVASSKQIQEKLFFRVCVPKESWDLCKHEDPNRSGGKFLPHDETNTGSVDARTPAILCPLANQHFNGPGSDGTLPERMYFWDYDEAVLNLLGLHIHCGSWRNMQLTDPPCKSVSFDLVSVRIAKSPIERMASIPGKKLRISGGITLGDIVDAICTEQDATLLTFDKDGRSGRPSIHRNGLIIDELCKTYNADGVAEGVLESLYVLMSLIDVVLPTSEEWAEMKKNGVLC